MPDLSNQPQNFLRVCCILADAGKKKDRHADEENTMRFREMWVIINTGDAMYSLSEKVMQENWFLRQKW